MIDILTMFGIVAILGTLFAFAVYGFIQFLSKKQYQIAYVDKYKQIVETSKLNCPQEIYEKQLVKAPDQHYSGISIGYIYGKNFIKLKANKTVKWFHLFVIAKRKKRIYDPFSWGIAEKLVIASKDKIKVGRNFNVIWTVGGLDYEGFYIFEAEGDLTPKDIFKQTEHLTGMKEATLTLKRQSRLVEEAAETNPIVKTMQKTVSELPEKE